MNYKPYTFTWPSSRGPAVERFDTLHELALFLAGWCHKGVTVQAVDLYDWRAA